jgi:hypothetical protein
MALAQCARCPEGIVHRRQQSGPFQLGVTILEVMNIPVPRFAHLFFPVKATEWLSRLTRLQPQLALDIYERAELLKKAVNCD